MSMDTPVAILFNSDGYSLEVKDGYSFTPSNSALLFAGKNGSTIKVANFDSSGNLLVSGSVTASNPSVSLTSSAPPSYATYIGGSVTSGAPSYTNGQLNALSLTTSGLLRIDGSSVTQPISGTVTANAGTGNFTVVQSSAANLNATVTGTVSAAQSGTWNITNISGTVSLPTGAATESTLNTINTSVSGLSLSQAAATSGQKAILVQGATTTAAPTYTTGTSNPLSLTTAGAIRVDGSAVTQPVSGTVAATQSGTWTVQPGNTANTTPWLTTISQGGNAATVTASNALKVDGSAVTQPISGTVTANAGTGTFITNLSQYGGASVGAANAIHVQPGTGATFAVSGTVAATQSGTWSVRNQDGAGNSLESSTTNPSGTERALIVRSIPSGTQTIAGASSDNTTNSSSKVPAIVARANTSAPAWTDGYMVPLSVDTAGALRITGSITANNSSVSTTGSAPPSSATYVGGSVTTTPPTYTTGQMNALSITTAGSLRTEDFSGVSTSSVTSVTSSATNTTILSANTGRRGAMIYNDSNQRLYIKFGTTASTTSFTVQIAAGGYYEFPYPIWRGQVDGLWSSANGAARVTELT